MRKIEKLRVGSIDVTGKSETFKELVTVVTENSAVQISDERSVMATVTIREIPEERGFFDLSVIVINTPGLATVDPPTVGVSVIGPPSKLDELTAASFRVVVDAAGLDARTKPYELVPQVGFTPPSLARQIELQAISQKTVSVLVQPAAE